MKNNVKQSDWYIGKYGTQSEVTVSTPSEKVPTFSMNISEVIATQSTDSSFFKTKLEEKGITLSTPAEEITPIPCPSPCPSPGPLVFSSFRLPPLLTIAPPVV